MKTLLTLLMISSAFAADLKSDTVKYVLPEQTVTGTRRETRWIENPTAITTISGKDQPTNRGLGLSDNLLLVPGMVALSRFGTDDIRLSVRGLGARSNTGVRGVRVLYDGIPESEPDGQTRLEGIEAGNLDRIEVLRGAGSALYGNAAGGVLNLRTAQSFPRAGARLDADGGAFGFYKVKLSAGTGPQGTDSAVSAAFDFRDLKLHIDEGMPGESGTVSVSQVKMDGWREHSAYEGQIATGSLTVHATHAAHLRAVMYFTNVSAEIPGPLSRAEFDSDPDQASPVYLTNDVRRYTRKGRIGLVYEREWSDRLRITLTPYTALKKLDRARENRRYQVITRYILGGTGQAEWQKELGEKIETEILAGFDQQLQDGPVSFYRSVGGIRTDTLLAQATERQWGQGLFAQWEMEQPGRWGSVIGVRWDRVMMNEDPLISNDPETTLDESAFTPRVGLRYHVYRDWVAFGSVCGGFETPTLSETENPVGYQLAPQKTLTLEGGLRGEQVLGGAALKAEATFYTMKVSDAVVPDTVNGENFFTNAGEATHRGVELSAKLTRQGWGYAGIAVSFGKYEFTDYTSRVGESFDGKEVPGVSPSLLSAIVRWEPREWFFAEATVRISGPAFADTRNTEQAAGWAVLGGAIGGRIPTKSIAASWHLGVQNLTDEKYVSFIQVNDSGGRYFESGMPQAVFGGISLGTPGIF